MTNPMAGSIRASALIVAAFIAMVVGSGCGALATRTDITHKATGLPRLLDIGASICIPCIMMAPELKELTTEYAGRLQVEFIDTVQNPGAKQQYDAYLCPTQIFLDASGKELYRHAGYYSKRDILAKWKELGIDVESPPRRTDAPGDAARAKVGRG